MQSTYVIDSFAITVAIIWPAFCVQMRCFKWTWNYITYPIRWIELIHVQLFCTLRSIEHIPKNAYRIPRPSDITASMSLTLNTPLSTNRQASFNKVYLKQHTSFIKPLSISISIWSKKKTRWNDSKTKRFLHTANDSLQTLRFLG